VKLDSELPADLGPVPVRPARLLPPSARAESDPSDDRLAPLAVLPG
jgi:hypothetical protein